MRFSGHQTFAIRDGWLYKGLRLVVEEPERMGDPEVADWLGVGKNMAKSIHHWLLATGLAEKDLDAGRRSTVLRPTSFGSMVWERDRFFLLPGTWWAIHVRLVNSPSYALTWNWFFNVFSSVRFERPVCAESLRRYLAAKGGRAPSPRTLDRDVACLLRSYAVSVPRPPGDPEDMMECPLSELGILLHSRQTGFYHMDRGLKPVPYELFGYALAANRERLSGRRPRKRGAGQSRWTMRDRSLVELAHEAGAPGRVFALTAEALYELVARYEARGLVRLDGQAGERIVRIKGRGIVADRWLRRYYDAAEAENRTEEAA